MSKVFIPPPSKSFLTCELFILHLLISGANSPLEGCFVASGTGECGGGGGGCKACPSSGVPPVDVGR